MNIKDFLARIHFQDNVATSYDCLAQLQECFLSTVPFENINIMDGKRLDYCAKSVFDKIVLHRRGGVCFENNSLFFWALTELGFQVRIIEAEMFPGSDFRGHFNHMALIVTLDGVEYLIDVGNGKYFGKPIDINSQTETIGENTRYKIVRYGAKDFALCLFDENEWKYRYAFRLEAKSLSDFTEMCHFVETSTESSFTQKVLVTIIKNSNRITLSDNRLLFSHSDGTKDERVVKKSEFKNTLSKHFGIKLE